MVADALVQSTPRMRPDILLLIIDDLRADIGAYGVHWARTPAIDALAAQSVTFLQAHAAVANCAPSRASLLTGLRPNTHGVLDLQTHVRDKHARLTTLPQRFRHAGYLAVSYGKVYHQFLDDEASWSPQAGFSLNDVPTKIVGAANHQDFAGVGVAVSGPISTTGIVRCGPAPG